MARATGATLCTLRARVLRRRSMWASFMASPGMFSNLRLRTARPPSPGGRSDGRMDGSVDADGGPGAVNCRDFDRGRAVQRGRRVDRRDAGTGVVRARGHLRRQRAVPDLLGLGAAVAGRRGVVDAVVGLRATAFGQEIEEVVGDARGVVHVDGGGRGGPAVL